MSSSDLNRGYAFSRKQDYRRAIDDFSMAFKLEPRLAVALYRRGEARIRCGEVKTG
jgi:hypothetical protein